MSRPSIASQVLEALADERRVIVADWRFHVTYMRVARSSGYALPDGARVHQLIKSLRSARHIEPIEDVSGIFRITIPYASILPAPQETILQEASPFAVFSYFTAAAYHDLTYEIPQTIHLAEFGNNVTRLPLGTTPEDWIDVPTPKRRVPLAIGGTPVQWSGTKSDWDFGHMVGHVQGNPIYVTSLERTMLDVLRFPDRSGGALEVLRIWKRAISGTKLDVLIDYANRFNQTLLRQRTGFLLEQLGVEHPVLDDWAKNSVRGSSARLIASREFSPTFSERWNLSINVPDSFLAELHDAP
jgi:predicted transcriptional regulator of viral defense system